MVTFFFFTSTFGEPHFLLTFLLCGSPGLSRSIGFSKQGYILFLTQQRSSMVLGKPVRRKNTYRCVILECEGYHSGGSLTLRTGLPLALWELAPCVLIIGHLIVYPLDPLLKMGTTEATRETVAQQQTWAVRSIMKGNNKFPIRERLTWCNLPFGEP